MTDQPTRDPGLQLARSSRSHPDRLREADRCKQPELPTAVPERGEQEGDREQRHHQPECERSTFHGERYASSDLSADSDNTDEEERAKARALVPVAAPALLSSDPERQRDGAEAVRDWLSETALSTELALTVVTNIERVLKRHERSAAVLCLYTTLADASSEPDFAIRYGRHFEIQRLVALTDVGRGREALAEFEHWLEKPVQESNTFGDVVNAVVQGARTAAVVGDQVAELRFLRAAKGWLFDLDDRDLAARLFSRYAFLCAEVGDSPAAADGYGRLIEFCERAGPDLEPQHLARALGSHALTQISLENFDQAVPDAQRLGDQLRASDDPELRSMSMRMLARTTWSLFQADQLDCAQWCAEALSAALVSPRDDRERIARDFAQVARVTALEALGRTAEAQALRDQLGADGKQLLHLGAAFEASPETVADPEAALASLFEGLDSSSDPKATLASLFNALKTRSDPDTTR